MKKLQSPFHFALLFDKEVLATAGYLRLSALFKVFFFLCSEEIFFKLFLVFWFLKHQVVLFGCVGQIIRI